MKKSWRLSAPRAARPQTSFQFTTGTTCRCTFSSWCVAKLPARIIGMGDTRKKQTGKSRDPASPDREDILRMSLGFRPGDPFEPMIKFRMAQYSDNLRWLRDNRPTGKPVRGALFQRCEELSREYLRVAAESASPEAFNQLGRLDTAVHAILCWIKPDHGQPLSGRQLENYALLLDLFGIPLLNAHMAVAAATRSPRGARIVVPRNIVISAADMRLQGKTWGQIARAFPKYKPNSLRKSVRAFDKLCNALAIPVPPKQGII